VKKNQYLDEIKSSQCWCNGDAITLGGRVREVGCQEVGVKGE